MEYSIPNQLNHFKLTSNPCRRLMLYSPIKIDKNHCSWSPKLTTSKPSWRTKQDDIFQEELTSYLLAFAVRFVRPLLDLLVNLKDQINQNKRAECSFISEEKSFTKRGRPQDRERDWARGLLEKARGEDPSRILWSEERAWVPAFTKESKYHECHIKRTMARKSGGGG